MAKLFAYRKTRKGGEGAATDEDFELFYAYGMCDLLSFRFVYDIECRWRAG